MDLLGIKPGVGIGAIKLGMTREQAKAVLGAAPQHEREDFEDGSIDEIWEYPDPDITLSFSSDDEFLLGSVAISHADATMDGAYLIGLDEEELLDTLESLGVEDLILDDQFGDLDAKNFVWEKKNVAFWLGYGYVTSVTVMPIYDEHEQAVWPALD